MAISLDFAASHSSRQKCRISYGATCVAWISLPDAKYAPRIMPAASRCRIREEMVEGEIKAWATYWAAYHAGGPPQTELDRLLEAAASESAAIEVRIERCPVCNK